ncbi:MAG: ribbon-helix-helix domain-containing protein [Rhodospirillaceae bacterium]|nr:ribbon-helix-helix domain-containing protein [Rhodospirillaceae bacterium]
MKKSDSLISRNVTINGRRTSLRMEAELWEALGEICDRESQSFHDVCTQIENKREKSNRTSAVRTYIIDYFRDAATEVGHGRAGHGGK